MGARVRVDPSRSKVLKAYIRQIFSSLLFLGLSRAILLFFIAIYPVLP